MPKRKLTDFRAQSQNANGHTPRGMHMLSEAIRDLGWIGAITVAANDEVFDGSARLETITEQMDTDPIVVDVNGDRPVVVRRVDIPNAADPRAKELAIAANRIAEVNLNWVLPIVESLKNEIPIEKYFRDDELAKLEAPEGIDDELEEAIREPMDGERYPLAIVLSYAELQEWKVIKESLGAKSDRDCLLKLMRDYT